MISKLFVAIALLSSVSAFAQEFAQPVFATQGVVAMSACSASLVRIKGTPDNYPALVLTNGHCTSGFFTPYLKPGQIYYHKPQTFRMRLLDLDGSSLMTLTANEIVYATMTATDMALLKLDQTYAQIKAQSGVDALYLSEVRPAAGTPVHVASGYHRMTLSCGIDGFAYNLREGDWTFVDSIRYDANCRVIPGTSGSPIWSPSTGEVIGVNNTVNSMSRSACALDNPCEVDQNGVQSSLPKRGYGQQTYWVYGCLDSTLQFNLNVPSCILPKGK